MLTDTDFWWHIASGDALKIGYKPYSDIFSFTTQNYPWLSLAWLWDIAYSVLNKAMPLYLPVVVTAIFNAFTVSLLAGFILRRVGPSLTIFTILLCVVPYGYMLTPRPHEVTFLMVALFYIICQRAFETKKFSHLTSLPLLMIIWANTHGGFFVGFVIVGAFLFQALVAWDKRLFAIYFLVLILCMVGSLLNPLGVDMYKLYYQTKYLPILAIITEWEPLQLKPEFTIHWIYVGLFIASFRFDNKTGIAEKLLSLFWLGSTLTCERNLPIFVLTSAPVLAVNLKSWAQRISPALKEKLQSKDESYAKDIYNHKIRNAVFLVSLLLPVILLSGLPEPLLSLPIPAEDPQEEAEFIRDNYPDTHFLNDYFQGGYILYVCRGKPAIYIDGRGTHAYPSEVVADYLKFHYGTEGWEKMIDKYGINGAILPKDNPRLPYFAMNSQWKLVHTGPLDVVYIRQK